MQSERDLIELLSRIAVAAERIAEHFAPAYRQRKPATLGTAAYTPEDREKQRIEREWQKAKLQAEQARGASGTPRSDGGPARG